MKAGLISDIHGNLPALEAVLEDMPAVDHIWCMGDIVGYNPWPQECLHLVRDVANVVVQGNHDRRAGQNQKAYKLSEDAREALEWTRSQLTEEDQDYLRGLPEEHRICDDQVLLSHSDPRRVDSYVYPKEFRNLNRFLDESEGVEVLVMGHTHLPHAEQVEGVLVVNPGSVGQPRDDDQRASYAVLDLEDTSVSFNRVEYDVDTVVAEIKRQGYRSGWVSGFGRPNELEKGAAPP